jgi:hypothetical protein
MSNSNDSGFSTANVNIINFEIISHYKKSITISGVDYERDVFNGRVIYPDGTFSKEFDIIHNEGYNVYVGKNIVFPRQAYWYMSSTGSTTIPTDAKLVNLNQCNFTNIKGYEKVYFPYPKLNKGEDWFHKVVKYSFSGRPEGYWEVDHKNNKKDDNRYSNLKYLEPTLNSFKGLIYHSSSYAFTVISKLYQDVLDNVLREDNILIKINKMKQPVASDKKVSDALSNFYIGVEKDLNGRGFERVKELIKECLTLF